MVEYILSYINTILIAVSKKNTILINIYNNYYNLCLKKKLYRKVIDSLQLNANHTSSDPHKMWHAINRKRISLKLLEMNHPSTKCERVVLPKKKRMKYENKRKVWLKPCILENI